MILSGERTRALSTNAFKSLIVCIVLIITNILIWLYIKLIIDDKLQKATKDVKNEYNKRS